MSEHLPECWFHDPAKTPSVAVNDGWPCICDRLSACEQRVRDEHSEVDAYRGWVKGYVAGVQAAREAVASLEPLLDRHKNEGGYDCCGCVTPGYLWTDALDAIDALREDK